MELPNIEDYIRRLSGPEHNSAVIALQGHDGQFRRDGVTPYIKHPATVAMLARHEPEMVRCVCWLHDLIEDTKVTAFDLAVYGVPRSIIEAVEDLTKPKEMSYTAYLERVRANPLALKVKIYDMVANLTDAPSFKQIEKYTAALQYLTSSPTIAPA
jgi:(p)ppGpp synthase/HD superfamily hydrolase